jgi:hypothetical protein
MTDDSCAHRTPSRSTEHDGGVPRATGGHRYRGRPDRYRCGRGRYRRPARVGGRGHRYRYRMVNSVRGPGERGFATLKAWRILAEARCCPQRVAPLAKAVLTLQVGLES